MKSKSKRQKLKQRAPQTGTAPAQWLFVSHRELRVRRIMEAAEQLPDLDIEIWEEAGVLEIGLPDGKSMDFEETACDLGDEESNRFLNENGAKTLMYVTISPESYLLAKPVMRKISVELEGFFCGDTDDFTPRVP